ncbi:InlB B-repeat-containing protein [Mobilitalea sibirica]|uniref:InlB B-repeat-containing protein n=1 Tax=Mobilitalea sibirica TaxID=1462919 RepID=A0A8J7HDU8_9FIRM|nr:InlB B-repeat-containing protein [Mobilitalea sibirica]MBH1941209.1 InlB B-repeat-containing protein [Mobilitalea sibirica]
MNLKKIITGFLTVVMLFGLLPQTEPKADSFVWDGTADTSWYNDTDTSFAIYTAEQLAGLAKLVNEGNDFKYKTITLEADIVLNDFTSSIRRPWKSIGHAYELPFNGTFEGNHHVISGIYADDPLITYQGLFGCILRSGTVKNVTVDGYISGLKILGGIVGDNHGSISGCINKVEITALEIGISYVGGITGWNGNGTITECYNLGKISGNGSDIGGIAGGNTGMVQNCYNHGDISGRRPGGIVGRNLSDAIITNCYSIGKIVSSYKAGGIANTNEGYIETGYCLEGTPIAINGEERFLNCSEKSEAAFHNGEVAYLLQENQPSQIWGQYLSGSDRVNYPVLSSSPESMVFLNSSSGYTNPTEVTLLSVSADGSMDTVTSTRIDLVFDTPIAGLSKDNITISSISGEVYEGALIGEGTNWSIALDAVLTQGNISVSLSLPIPPYIFRGSPSEVMVYKVPAVITEVTVTPDYAVLRTGNMQSFTALVEGTNYPSQMVDWSVSGNHSSATRISDLGVLTIASDETATELTVEAVSKENNTKSGTATVTVIKDNHPPVANNPVPVLELLPGGRSETLCAFEIASDEDKDTLSIIDIKSLPDSKIAQISFDKGQVTINGIDVGNTFMVVTVSDGKGGITDIAVPIEVIKLPVVDILIKQSPIKRVQGSTTYELFYQDSIEVTLSFYDDTISRYEYQMVALEDEFNMDGTWNQGSTLKIDPDFKGHVFVRAVYPDGATTLINAQAVIVDKTKPSIYTNYDASASRIDVTVTDMVAGIDQVICTIGSDMTNIINLEPAIENRLQTQYDFTIENLQEGNYGVLIGATDNSGNVADFQIIQVNTGEVPNIERVIVLDDGGGTGSASPASAVSGAAITLSATPNIGYRFKEWQVISPNTLSIQGDTFIMPDQSVTVKAIFEASTVDSHGITFLNDGNIYTSRTVQAGECIGSANWVDPPTRTGYIFNGWYTGINGTGTSFTAQTIVNASITVYAKWIANSNEGPSGGGNDNSDVIQPVSEPEEIIPITQGWVMDDEGQWFCYEEGEPLVGWCIIDDNLYYFNSDGVMQTGWKKDDKGNWYYLTSKGPYKKIWNLRYDLWQLTKQIKFR